MYDIEKYYQALSVDDAIRALSEDPKAIIINGGTDVLVQIREGRLAGASLVSIHGLPELSGISMTEDGTIRIGSICTFSEITNNPIIEKYIPILGNAVDTAGGPQLRNAGTIGGNVSNGVTSADSASSLMVLNAVIELKGPEGIRQVPISEWYTGPGKTVRGHEEVVCAILIRKEDYEGYFGHYIKYGKRNAMEIATLGCAVNLKLSADKSSIEDIRIGYGVAAPTPIRCREVEKTLKGMKFKDNSDKDSEENFGLDEVFIKTMTEGVLKEVNPRTSWRASKEFRLQLIKELVVRATAKALEFGGAAL